jgi:hypothetical protein
VSKRRKGEGEGRNGIKTVWLEERRKGEGEGGIG